VNGEKFLYLLKKNLHDWENVCIFANHFKQNNF